MNDSQIIPAILGLVIGVIITYLLTRKSRNDKEGFLRSIKEKERYYFLGFYSNPNDGRLKRENIIKLGRKTNFGWSLHGRERYYSYDRPLSEIEKLQTGIVYCPYKDDTAIILLTESEMKIKKLEEED